MKLKINYIIDNNIYYQQNQNLFIRLVNLIENYPYSFGQMLRAKGRKRYIIKHPDYIPPYKDIYDWINESLPLLKNSFYKISTKCYWILNGLIDFPNCAFNDCNIKFENINVEINQGYPIFCLHHSKCNPITLKKRKISCRKKFGTDFPMQADEVKAKQAATNLKNIGYTTPLASPKHRELGKQTKLKLYGSETYHNSEQAKQTYKEHSKEQSFIDDIRNKTHETNIKNGHDANWTNRDKAIDTRLKNHDGIYWTDEMTEKANITIENNRKNNPNYDIEKQQKIEETTFKNFGVKCALQSDKAKMNLQKWIEDHGGGLNVFQTDYVKNKSRNTMNDKYGVDYALQAPEIKAKYDFDNIILKGNETKRCNGTFNTSKPEEEAYLMLCEKFTKDDIERQYKSEKYPFRCDFYVRSQDLYIECNYHWTHGGHWFDPNSSDDQAKLQVMKDKNTKFYDIAIKVWTDYDVKKLKAANDNKLNYFAAWQQSDLINFLDTYTFI